MRPEFEKRAPGAKDIIKKHWWRLPVAAAVALTAVVSNENESPNNMSTSPQEGHVLVLNFSPYSFSLEDLKISQDSIEVPLSAVPNIDETGSGGVSSSVSSQEIEKELSHQTTNDPKEYTVKEGDSLSKIAREIYGKNELWPALAHVNGISNPNLLYTDTKLTIPPQSEAESIMESLPPTTYKLISQIPVLRIASTTLNVETSLWDLLARCESRGNWVLDTGNGFYGGLQFTLKSWQLAGGTGNPAHASREEQIMRAKILLAIQGWNAWPACSSLLGLR